MGDIESGRRKKIRWSMILAWIALVPLAVIYQNCGAVNFGQRTSSSTTTATNSTTPPPTVVIDSGPTGETTTNPAVFTFHGSSTNSTITGYECNTDGSSWSPCLSGDSFPVAVGSHIFSVRALEATGAKSDAATRPWIRQAYLFVPTKPCRFVDTRATSPHAPLLPNTPQTFNFAGVSCTSDGSTVTIPSTGVGALAINVTMADGAYGGHLAIGNGSTSTINWIPAQAAGNANPSQLVKANNAIAKLDAPGTLTMTYANDQSLGTIDVIVDVFGYYQAMVSSSGAVQPVNSTHLAYSPMPSKCRIADTRLSSPVSQQSVRTFSVAGAACKDANMTSTIATLPASGIGAVDLNMTVIGGSDTTQLTAGSVALYSSDFNPASGSLGTTNINFSNYPMTLNGLANGAKTGVGADGKIKLYMDSANSLAITRNIILDVSGYFSATDPNGLVYVPMPPCRILDTRGPPLTAALYAPTAVQGAVSLVSVGGQCGLPTRGIKALAINGTIMSKPNTDTTPLGPGFFDIFQSGGAALSLINWSILMVPPPGPNITYGTIVPNGTTVKVDPTQESISLFQTIAAGSLYYVIDLMGYYTSPTAQ